MAPRKRFTRFLLALLSVVLIVPTATFTDAAGPTRIPRQPLYLNHMISLVTPDDPSVLDTLHSLLGKSSYNPVDVPHTINDFAVLRAWIDNIRNVSDEALHGVNDYWQTPAETISVGAGDCEDIAILFVSLLRAYGVPEDQAYVTVGEDINDKWHAYVLEKCCLGVWRALDPQNGSQMSLLSQGGLDYSVAYCFNDNRYIRGLPSSANAEIYLSGISTYPWTRGASTIFKRHLNKGEKVDSTVLWLVSDINSGFWPIIYYPWSLNIYDQAGNLLASWKGNEPAHTLEFTALSAGNYYLEVLKRDPRGRYFRFEEPSGWKLASQNEFTPPDSGPEYDVTQLNIYEPDGYVYKPMNTPPAELVDYILGLINNWKKMSKAPALLVLGNNPAAQVHAEEMLANKYFALWDMKGLTPGVNHFIAGGQHFSGESVYFTKLNWTGAKDENYVQYLKSVLQGALNAWVRNFNDARYIDDPANKVINVGLAYDENYLFLVADYEYGSEIAVSDLSTVKNGMLYLSGKVSSGLPLTDMRIYYLRPPQSFTGGQLNATGIDSLNVTGGLWVASVSSPANSSKMPSTLYPVNWALPEYPQVGGGDMSFDLSSKSPVLVWQPTITSSSFVYFTPDSAWKEKNGVFEIQVNLSEVISRFGPGIYTVELSYGFKQYMMMYDNFMPVAESQARYSFFVQ